MEAGDAQGAAEADPGPPMAGVPVVEDEDDTDVDEEVAVPFEDEASSAGVREEEDREEDIPSAGVCEDEVAEGRAIGGTKVPRAPPCTAR